MSSVSISLYRATAGAIVITARTIINIIFLFLLSRSIIYWRISTSLIPSNDFLAIGYSFLFLWVINSVSCPCLSLTDTWTQSRGIPRISSGFSSPLKRTLEKLSNQRHLRAIRDGIIATLPLIIVSSLLMVIAFSYNQMPESWGIRQVIQDNAVAILLPYRMSMYIMTLYAVFGILYPVGADYSIYLFWQLAVF